jgi:hypothetical protein
LLPIIDCSRRLAFLSAFAGGLATAIALAAVHGVAAWLYLAVLFLNLVFSEWAWAAASMLEAELFPHGGALNGGGHSHGVCLAHKRGGGLRRGGPRGLTLLFVVHGPVGPRRGRSRPLVRQRRRKRGEAARGAGVVTNKV